MMDEEVTYHPIVIETAFVDGKCPVCEEKYVGAMRLLWVEDMSWRYSNLAIGMEIHGLTHHPDYFSELLGLTSDAQVAERLDMLMQHVEETNVLWLLGRVRARFVGGHHDAQVMWISSVNDEQPGTCFDCGAVYHWGYRDDDGTLVGIGEGGEDDFDPDGNDG